MTETTLARESRRETAERIRRLLEAEGATVFENISGKNRRSREMLGDLEDHEALREAARATKEAAIAELPTLVETVRESVEANGGSVYLADDATDANRYVAEVARDAGAGSVVKSKSMTTEELDLNEHLEAEGVEVWETDLGEFVLQVADEAPSHLVGPASHKSRAEIAELFEAHFDPDEPLESAEDLTRFARDFLGENIEAADVGITGANFVVAESGTVVLVTNEGNARKCAVTPDTHVAVAGVEKLVPELTDLHPFLQLVPRAAGGSPFAGYVSMLTPPTASPTIDFDRLDEPIGSAVPRDDGGGGTDAATGNEARDFHLVLVDNGRMAMRDDDDLRETLYCVRCGACANTCANFQHVGGHAFGGETYTGGIATGWEAAVHGLDAAASFNDLCTGCSRCVPACPVQIDIPWINTVVRDRLNRGADPGAFDSLVEGLTPDEEPAGLDVQKRLFGNVGTLARLGSATAPVSNWVTGSGPARWLAERALGVDRRRALPTFQRETLVDWFAARDGSTARRDLERSVVLYPDVYTNHVLVERGKAAVRVLEALGCAVELASPVESGRAPLSQGMVATARDHAEAVAADLGPSLEADRDVVVVEPSDLAAFRGEYERLLDGEIAARLADSSYEVVEYVYGLLENGADASDLRGPTGETGVAYHAHCQARTLGLDAYTETVLDRLGYDVRTSDVECCGMAGSFGYKREYYELSMDVGEELRRQFQPHVDAGRPLVASGASCAEQLGDLFSRDVAHPVELVSPR